MWGRPASADTTCANIPITSVPPAPLVNANLQCDSLGNLKINLASGTVTQPYTAAYGQTATSTGSFTGLAGFSTFGGGSGVDAWTFGPSAGPSGGLGLPLGTPGVPYMQGIGPYGSVPIFSSTGFPIADSTLTYNAKVDPAGNLYNSPSSLSGSGTIATSGATLPISVGGYNAISMHIAGTFVGTVNFEADDGGGTNPWNFLPCYNSNNAVASSTTVAADIICTVAPHKTFTVYWSAYTSGSATITYNLGNAANVAAPQGVTPSARSSSGATYLTTCDSNVAVNISTATTTQVLAAASSNWRICSISLSVAGTTTPTATIEYGTGTTCGTGTTVLSGALPAGTYTYGSGIGTIFPALYQKEVCIVSGGTGPSIQGMINYTQF